MLALYLLALGFGSTLIIASLLLGGHGSDDHGADHGPGEHDHDVGHADADHDHDVAHADADHDHDHDAGHADADHAFDKPAAEVDHGVWLPFLSLRFWTFGMASFGLGGTLLTLLSVPDVVSALVATLAGLAFGTAAAYFFRALRRDHVSGETSLDRLAGEEGRVVVPIRPGQPGKIVIQTLAGRVEMMATTRDSAPIEVGSAVIVAEVRAGVADVSRLPGGSDGEHRQKSKERAQQRASQGRTEV